MEYFCPRCEWTGEKPKIQFFEGPDMDFGSYTACPKCHSKVIELRPKKMVYGRWYWMGSYTLRWK